MNVQERLQLKRIPLDKWSTREQLCLAMAVLCSGDQNWMSVSRALKMMCGTNRPTDWFSQKFCAAQYGKLLENVETPKRKKRTASERDNPAADVTIIPGELIVRKLVQERTAELQKLVEEERQEYQKLMQDIRQLQADELTDDQVLAMWDQIEQENREKEQEQQKHAQWLKEREEKKIEMERAWRPGAIVAASMSPTSNSNSSGSPSRSSPSLFLKTAAAGGLTPKVEPVDGDAAMPPDTPMKQGTSPLLTSLLKSPSSTPSTPTPTTTVSNRALAPTITNLLTGGSGAAAAVTQAVNSPGFVTQNVPNSGSSFFNFPSKHPQHQSPTTATTPSKAAPTLSKLLDPSRSKAGSGAGEGQSVTAAAATGGVVGEEDVINMEDDQQLMEVFKELMPDDLADILTDNTEMIVTPELLAQDLENVTELIQTQGAGTANQGRQQPAAVYVAPTVVSVEGGSDAAAVNSGFPVEEVKKETENVTVKEEQFDACGEAVTQETEENVRTTGGNDAGEEIKEVTAMGSEQKEDVVAVEEANDDAMELDDTVAAAVQDGDENNQQIVGDHEEARNLDHGVVKEDVKDEEESKKEGGVADNLEQQLAAFTNEADEAGEETAVVVVVEEDKEEHDEEKHVEVAVENATEEGNDSKEVTEKRKKKNEETEASTIQNGGNQEEAAKIDKSLSSDADHEAHGDKSEKVDNTTSQDIPQMREEEKETKPEDVGEAPEDDEVDQEEVGELPLNERESANEDDLPMAAAENPLPAIAEEEEEDDGGASSSAANASHRTEERKPSTTSDNEDHFEDAKSTLGGDSGNPPEDLEMTIEEDEAGGGKNNALVEVIGGGDEDHHHQQQQQKDKDKEREKEKSKGSSGGDLNSSSTNVTAENSDRSSRSKRDMPRRNRSQASSSGASEEKRERPPLQQHLMEDSGEETKSSSASNLSLRARMKDRDRSESPLVMDEDTSDAVVIPRTRRRYSSTPVIDSVPSSPASGDDREYKNWKKSVLIAFNQFSTLHYKYSAVLVQQVPDEFKDVILRPMDMQTIKRNIETGVVRTTVEFQRDVLLMVQNALMMNTRRDRDWLNLIQEMLVEVHYWKRETEKNLSSRESDSSAGGSSREGQGKVRNRKSMRITTTAS